MIGKAAFRFWRFLFSLKGRVSRWPILTIVVPIHIVFWFAPVVRWYLLKSFRGAHADDVVGQLYFYSALSLVWIAVWLMTLWPLFALSFKRLHDANLSGVFALPSLFIAATVFIDPFREVLAAVEKVARPAPFFHGTYYWWAYRIVVWAVAIVPVLLPPTKGANRFGPPTGERPASPDDVF